MQPVLELDTTITEAMIDGAYAAAAIDYDHVFSEIAKLLAQDDVDELGAGQVTPATPKQARANARALHDDNVDVGIGYCLRTVRGPEFLVPALHPDAETAWEEAELKHLETDPLKIPRGAIPFWTNGRFGHVALSVGGGLCWTTDYRRPGRVDLAPIASLASWCGGQLVGWAEDLNGVDCWPNERQHRPVFDIDDRIRIIHNTLERKRRRHAPQLQIDGVENWLHRLEARRDKQARGLSDVNVLIVRPVPEEQMTWRARAYLTIAAGRHLLTGAAAAALSSDFDGDGFQVVRAVLPIWLWGVIFIAGGLHLTHAAYRGSELHARIALSMSAVLTSVWAAGMVMAYGEGGVVSPVGGILFTALTLKDLVICRQPMRSPFEPIVKEYIGPTRGD